MFFQLCSKNNHKFEPRYNTEYTCLEDIKLAFKDEWGYDRNYFEKA